MIRIALLEEINLKRKLYAISMNQLENITVVVKAKNIDVLIAKLKITPVDIVVYCCASNVALNFLHLTQLQKAHPSVKVLLLSTSFSFDVVFKLLQFKNCGYFEEKNTDKHLIKAMKHLMEKGNYFEPNLITQQRLEKHQEQIKTKVNKEQEFQFTKKQKEVITDMIDKLSSEEICRKHSIAKNTLYSHCRDIMRITNTCSMKTALIEIIFASSNAAKRFGIKVLIALCLCCNGIDTKEDTTNENNEVCIENCELLEAC